MTSTAPHLNISPEFRGRIARSWILQSRAFWYEMLLSGERRVPRWALYLTEKKERNLVFKAKFAGVGSGSLTLHVHGSRQGQILEEVQCVNKMCVFPSGLRSYIPGPCNLGTYCSQACHLYRVVNRPTACFVRMKLGSWKGYFEFFCWC